MSAQGHSRESLIRLLQSRSAANQGMHSNNPISLGPNSKAALRNMFDRVRFLTFGFIFNQLFRFVHSRVTHS